MVQYLHVVDLVLPQYGVWIHFSFLIRTVAILTVLMIVMAEPYVLLEFCTMMSLNNFIKSFFENLAGVSLETQYDLQYIGVQISDNLKQEIIQSLQRKRKSLHNKVYQTKKKIVDPTSIFR